MKRIFFLMLIVCILIMHTPQTVNASGDSYSWYCKRNVDNLQPNLAGEFVFINNYDALWLNTSRNDNDNNKIAYLTFDAGYENGNIARILDVLKAYHDCGFDGYIRPDHGRHLWGETPGNVRPGYGLYDRALGIMYMLGVWDMLEKQKGEVK